MAAPSISRRAFIAASGFMAIGLIGCSSTTTSGAATNGTANDGTSGSTSSANNQQRGKSDYRGKKVDGSSSDLIVTEGPGWVFDSKSGTARCAAAVRTTSTNTGWSLSVNAIARDASGKMVGSSGIAGLPDCVHPDHSALVYFEVTNLTESPTTIDLTPTVMAWYDNSTSFDPYLEVTDSDWGLDDNFGIYATLEVHNPTDHDFGSVTANCTFYDSDDKLITGIDGYESGIPAGGTIAVTTNHLSCDNIESVYARIDHMGMNVVGGNYNP